MELDVIAALDCPLLSSGFEDLSWVPLTHSQASLVAGEESACNTGNLGWEDPLEKKMATSLQDSDLEYSRDCIVHGVTKSWTQLNDFHFHLHVAKPNHS